MKCRMVHDTLTLTPMPTDSPLKLAFQRALPPGIEIVVVYGEGGDYITREQLDWYRKTR